MSDSPQASPRHRRRAFTIVFLTVFIDLVGFGIVIPLNPYLAREFGASPLGVGLLMAVYSFFQFVMNPVWGRLSDRVGRRPILLLGLLGSCLSHLLFAFGSELWVLFLARGLGGFFAATIATAMAYMADLSETHERSKAMGIVGAAFGMGFVFGPALGGGFSRLGESLGEAPPLGPSLAALAAAILCLANFAAALRFLRESLPAERRGRAVTRPSRFRLIARHLTEKVVGTLLLVSLLHAVAMANMEVSLFLFVGDRFGLSVAQASFGFAYIGLVMAFTQGYLVRKLIPVLGERKMLLGGLALSAAGFVLIGASLTLLLLGVAVTLLGIGVGLIQPSLTGSLSVSTDPANQGAVLGVNQSLSALARIVGPVIGGLLYGAASQALPFFAATSLAILGLLLVIYRFRLLPEAGLAQPRAPAPPKAGATPTPAEETGR